jgi:hypothetical protein
MNISGFQLQRRAERRNTLRNVAAMVAILVIFVLASRWDYNEMSNRALTTVAQNEAVRSRTNALSFCKAPSDGQVLVMRPDAGMAQGYSCATYERFDWPQAPVVAQAMRPCKPAPKPDLWLYRDTSRDC